MKKIILGLTAVMSISTSAFAETNCQDLAKKTVTILAAGSMPSTGRFGVDVEVMEENATLKMKDASGNEFSIQTNIFRATAFKNSHGTSYLLWTAEGYDSTNGCSMLKITQEGVR